MSERVVGGCVGSGVGRGYRPGSIEAAFWMSFSIKTSQIQKPRPSITPFSAASCLLMALRISPSSVIYQRDARGIDLWKLPRSPPWVGHWDTKKTKVWRLSHLLLNVYVFHLSNSVLFLCPLSHFFPVNIHIWALCMYHRFSRSNVSICIYVP